MKEVIPLSNLFTSSCSSLLPVLIFNPLFEEFLFFWYFNEESLPMMDFGELSKLYIYGEHMYYMLMFY